MRLNDRVVLITGGSEGIGRATAEVFRRRGAKVAVVALPGPELESMRAPDVALLAGDITDERTREQAVALALDTFGRLDVLVNNAGIGLYSKPSDGPLDLARRVFEVNVWAALGMAQAAVPVMRKQGGGTIVNIGSVGGYVSLPWAPAYCASKFALHAFSDSLRRELKRDKIHVMKVCPGIVDTKFRKHVLGGSAPDEISDIKRVVTPERVAEALVRGVQRGARTVYVPRIGRLFACLDFISPRMTDWYLARKW